MRVVLIATLAALAAAMAAAPAGARELRAGVGKADITPRTGYYLGGWTRADRVAGGQHTRLHARAMVLGRGERKVALVAVDLFMVPGGLVAHLGERLRDIGLSEQSILASATHTHSGPGGFANYPTLNTAAPSLQTITDPMSFVGLLNPEPADPQLYAFLLGQIETAIRRANADLGPAAAGWGDTRILGLTRNRSLEAHLANHGVIRERGQGTEAEDPEGGYLHTIDPGVNVLRVDRVARRRGRGVRRPLGAWSTFANHGTVTKSSFEFYNGDHHASAMRVFEARVRRAGRVPGRHEIVNVYGNSNEGDMSAGLNRHGPAASDYVGRVEAAAMFRAWRAARRTMSRRAALDVRWTRICFCGQEVEGGGRVADRSQVGLPFLTGSEEERGPLHDVTGQHFEGQRNEAAVGPHAPKYAVPAGEVPNRVPIMALRVGDGLIVSVPGEGTKEVGARIRAAVGSAVAGSAVRRIVVSGLANEFVLYFTTPEEYDRQHYEGGNTHFGRLSSVLLTSELAGLAGTLVRGEAAPEPAPFDPTNGVSPDGPPYPDGAAEASPLQQPAAAYERLARAEFGWRGGPRGLDRPVDRAFVVVQRRTRGGWVRADDDLGLAMLWSVDGEGNHRVRWEIPRDTPTGVHRFVIHGKRYGLVSRAFTVRPSTAVTVLDAPAAPGRVAIRLGYPAAVRDVDLTYRPRTAPIGRLRLTVGRRTVVVRGRGRRTVSIPARSGQRVTLAAGAARDRHGNRNAEAVALR